LDARRDWGHAKDYVEMQWLMLQQSEPEDYVIATGQQYSVRDFIHGACQEVNLDLTWDGEAEQEKGYDQTGKCIVAVDPRYYRPTEVETLLGDATKARQKLGWEPKYTFKQLVVEMMEEDLKSAQRDSLVEEHGYHTYRYHE
ncbi:MAG: GDP-mannose 4,6-dehydratase, partial [Thermosynechococcaceae cyanobacterium]